jgi:hypothetical protein
MILIRLVAYQKIETAECWFNNKTWHEMLVLVKKYINAAKPDLETLSVVGNGIYDNMFNSVINEIGLKKTNYFVKYLQKKIPHNQTLTKWAKNKSKAIKPDDYLITELSARFAEEYPLLKDDL